MLVTGSLSRVAEGRGKDLVERYMRAVSGSKASREQLKSLQGEPHQPECAGSKGCRWRKSAFVMWIPALGLSLLCRPGGVQAGGAEEIGDGGY